MSESGGTGSGELSESPVERVQDIIDQVLEALDLDADFAVSEDDDEISAAIEGEDLGILIGRRGTTIDALQLLCYRAAFVGREQRKRVTVDAAGYRLRRRELIDREADGAARRALEAGGPVELEPMSASERRLVHDRLKDRPEVETYSEGDEPDRRVVVSPLVAD